MSRRMMISPRSAHSRRSAAAGALALALALSLSACGGGDSAEATQDTAAAAGAIDESKPHTHPEGEEHDDAAGMNMSEEEHATAGHDEAAAIPADAEFNAQDVKFLQHMIDHHGQAVDMSDMVLKTSTDPEVKKLGTAIHGAQAPEIEKMTGWLESWKQSTENAAHEHDPNAPSAGMMKEEDMAKLAQAKGKAFDKLFLTQMISHHEGALNQSKAEVEKGKFPEAVKLAKVIIKAQTAEIKQMKAMLAKSK